MFWAEETRTARRSKKGMFSEEACFVKKGYFCVNANIFNKIHAHEIDWLFTRTTKRGINWFCSLLVLHKKDIFFARWRVLVWIHFWLSFSSMGTQ